MPVVYRQAVRQVLPTRATAIIVGANRDRQRLGPLDQPQSYADVMEPFLQFAVHKAPLREKHGDQLVLITL
jgi:hypothetical protein